MKLTTVLKRLDASKKEHWTATGLPNLNWLRTKTHGKVTRSEVDAIVGSLTRDSLKATTDIARSVTSDTPDEITLETPESLVKAARENLGPTPRETAADSPPQAQPAPEAQSPKESGEGALTDVQAGQQAVKEALHNLEAAKQAADEAQNILAAAIAREQDNPANDFQARNKRWQKAQHAQVKARHEREKAARDAGLIGKPMAPVDQSLAQRRKTDRPTLPVQYGNRT